MSDVCRELAAAVAARRPVDARERAAQAAFAEHFERLASPCDEHADPVHVTSSAIVVADPQPGTHVVLHLHRRLGKWLQPGGHIEPGESPAAAALRETLEETGLAGMLLHSGQVIHVDVHPGPRGHTHLDVRYLIGTDHVEPSPSTGESPHVAWFAWAEAIALAEPGLEGILRVMQPGEPVVRRAVPGDLPAIGHVAVRADAYVRESRWSMEALGDLAEVRVADLDGTIVGVAGGDQEWIDPAWVDRHLDL